MSRPGLAAVAALVVVTCGLAAFLVLGSTASTQSVSASSAAEVAQAEPITGTLSKPAYTVIALDSGGNAKTALAAADGSFTLTPTAETVSLHLRAPDGTYAGPITLAESEAAIAQLELKVSESKTKVENSKTKVNNSGAKVRQAKKQVKRATKKVKKAKRKLKKASGRQAIRKARKNLRQAKKKLRRAKKRLRQAKKNLSKARAQLQLARNELQAAQSQLQAAQQRQTGERAILGVNSASALGSIQVDSAAGFAKAEASTVAQWESWVDTERWAQASGGVPIGVGNFGRVSSTELSGSGVGDLDRDGVSDPLDIDDDGDLVLDNIDGSPAGTSARTSEEQQASHFGLSSVLLGDFGIWGIANANAGVADDQLEQALPRKGYLFIDTSGEWNCDEERCTSPAELDCGGPQGSDDPGLVYCTPGGIGQISFKPDIESEPEFPECCDEDQDGFGEFTQFLATGHTPGTFMSLHPQATSDQIQSGDVLIERLPSGEESVATLQYVFTTNSALVSYDDGQGNSAAPNYPVPPGGGVPGSPGMGLPVEAGPSGDVVLDLTFWRPQRRPVSPETGDWIDIGGLRYYATLANQDPQQFTCEQGAYSSSDPDLTPVAPEDNEGFGTGGGFTDLSADRPASPDNTFTYQLNLTECLESKGLSFEPGEERGFNFGPRSKGNDITSLIVHFKREE